MILQIGNKSYQEEVKDKYVNSEKIYPNPFSNNVNIEFSIEEDAIVSLQILDITGRTIQTLLNNVNISSGIHEETFTPNELEDGIYFYKLQIDDTIHTGKMVLKR